MGLRLVRGTLVGTRQWNNFTLQLTRGTLVHASVYYHGDTDFDTEVAAEITIRRTEPIADKTTLTLVSGFVSNKRGLAWHGTLPINEADYVSLRVAGNDSDRITFAAYVQDVETSRTGVPRDP